MLIYVGDGKDVIKRIKNNHLRGNVEASSLRKHIAISMGYEISASKRLSGSTRLRIALPDPKEGERYVSSYLSSGLWQYIICDSYEEANAFQWYAIEKLQPLLNKDRRAWDERQLAHFEVLLKTFRDSPLYQLREFINLPSGSGVYSFYHQQLPSDI